MNNQAKLERKFEIIAPAGDIQSLAAAVKAGADAIYFGFKGQNARGRAKNFEDEEVLKSIAFLREKGIKSYITLNTVVTENQLNLLEKRLVFLSLMPPDAIIIQDLAVLELGRKILPSSVEFHASTQMGICNLDGLKFAEKCGIKQVVLARELNFKELKYLSEKTKLKLEVFVFGAMCYSVSGYCYASLIEKRRSGNRGVCAQICRQKFNNSYPFSMKDLNLIEKIPDLVKAGIKHFKIEGRMKGADYVFTTVSALKEVQKDLSKNGIKRAKNILEDYPFLRETGDGYLHFPLKDRVFTKNKHSVQIYAGKVKKVVGKTIELNAISEFAKAGLRVKAGEIGATIVSVNKNKITLSSRIKAKIGDKVFLYPNSESVKGIKGIVNSIVKKPLPIEFMLNITVQKHGVKAKLVFNNKQTYAFEIDTEGIEAKNNPLTEDTLLKKLKSNEYTINELKINKNNLIFKPSVFKELKEKIKEIARKEKEETLNYRGGIHKEYPEFKYSTPPSGFVELPPVYYNNLDIKTERFIANNVGQLIFDGEKFTGKFIPVCNRVASYFLKNNFNVKGFVKPYEIEPDKLTPHFIARVKPEKIPSQFSVEKKGDIFFIKKKRN